MKYNSFKSVQDFPKIQEIPEAHLGVTFDYLFMGRPQGKTGVHLLVETVIIDHFENRYSRKTEHLLQRKDVKNCVRSRIEEHLLHAGVNKVQTRGMLRDLKLT